MANTYELLMKIGGKLDGSYGSVISKATSKLSMLGKATKPVTSGIKAVGSKLAGLAGGIVAGITLDKVAETASNVSKNMSQMDAVLKSTGGAAGMSKEALVELAESQEKLTTYSSEATESAENMLLTFTNIKSNVFPQTLKITEDMATAMHTDATSAAMQLGKALNDPTTGYSKLQRVGVTFTASQIKTIKAMEKAGNTAGAQKVMLEELTREFGGSAQAAGDTVTGQITRAKNVIMATAAKTFSAMLPIVSSLLPQVVNGVQKASSFIESHIPQISSVVSTVAKTVSSVVGGVTSAVIPLISPIINDIQRIASNLLPGLGSSAGNLQGKISFLVTGGLTLFKSGLDWVANHGPVVKGALIGLAAAVGIVKAVTLAAGAIQQISNARMIAGALAEKGMTGAELALKGARGGTTLATTLYNAATVKSTMASIAHKAAVLGDIVAAKLFGNAEKQGIIQLLAHKAASIASAVATNAMGAASKVAAAGQWLLNAAMNANPIGIIITLIAALVAAFILLWNTCKPFRDFWIGTFNAIKSAFVGFINMIISGLDTLISGLNSFKVSVPGWVPLVGGKTFGFNIPMIPKLANGGIIKHQPGGIIANIGEGNYDEAVVPLKNRGAAETDGDSGGSIQISYAPQIIIYGNASKADVKAAFSDAQKEFDAHMKVWMHEHQRRSPGGKVVFD